MSTTSQLTDFSDLYTDLQNRVRVEPGVTATENQAKRYINIALHDMHLGFDYKFPWAERLGRLITQPQYTTGTCTISKGSSTLTGVSTLWNTNNDFGVPNMRVNGKIKIGGSRTPYIISAVASDTSATLSSKFTEETQTAVTYIYYEDEYDLATDFLRPIDIQRFSTEVPIDLLSRQEFRRRYPSNSVPTNFPAIASILDHPPSGNTTPVRRVVFHPPPAQAMNIPYAYITNLLAVSSAGSGQANLSADGDEPIVPLRYRHALVFHALYHWYRDKKDDKRRDAAKDEYTDIMLRIVSDNEVGSPRPQLRPRVNHYRSNARRPYSRAHGRRLDGFGKFDQMQ